MQDTRTPVIAACHHHCHQYVDRLVLLDSLGHVGLAIGLTVSTAVEAMILLAVLRKRIGGLDPDLAAGLARVLIATAIMAMMAEFVTRNMNKAIAGPDTSESSQSHMVGYAIALAGATYFVAAWIPQNPRSQQP